MKFTSKRSEIPAALPGAYCQPWIKLIWKGWLVGYYFCQCNTSFKTVEKIEPIFRSLILFILSPVKQAHTLNDLKKVVFWNWCILRPFTFFRWDKNRRLWSGRKRTQTGLGWGCNKDTHCPLWCHRTTSCLKFVFWVNISKKKCC